MRAGRLTRYHRRVVQGSPSVPGRAGRRLGRYETIARIATGGMAEVYLARQIGPLNFAKLVVIKTIHPHLAQQREIVDMLLDEARIAAQLRHPNIIDVYDLGHDGGTYFIAMEYLAGESLADIIVASRRSQRLGIFSVAALIADCAVALHVAHTWTGLDGRPLGVVHRDVTPGNIVVLYSGNVKLVDFGVAKARGRAVITNTEQRLKGKIGYVAPEQLEGAEADPRCDVFSLGIVLWEALALRRLFWAPTEAAVVRAIMEGNVAPPSRHALSVPRELDAICLRALARNPEERYPTARAFADDLRSFLRDANYHDHERVVAGYLARTFRDRIREREVLIRRATEARPSGEVLDLPALRAASEPDFSEPEIELVAGSHGPARFPLPAPDDSVPEMPPADTTMPVYSIQELDGVIIEIDRFGHRTEITSLDYEDASDVTEAGPLANDHPRTSSIRIDEAVIPRRPQRGLRVLWIASGVALALILYLVLRPRARDDATAVPAALPTAPETAAAVPAPAVPPDLAHGGPAAPPVADREAPPAPPPASSGSRTRPRRERDTPVDRDAASSAGRTGAAATPQRLYNEGARLQVAGDTTGAIAKFKAALALDRKFAAAYRGLGLAYERLGRADRAAQAFRSYLALAGAAPDAAAIRARLARLARNE